MKQGFFYFTFISFLVLSLNSCKNDDVSPLESEAEIQIERSEMIELGLVTPFVINDVEGGSEIGFLESARPFFLNEKLKDSKEFSGLLNNAIKTEAPLRVYLFPETSNIAFVEDATEADMEIYKIFKVVPPKSKSTAPVIPNETILNQILNDINSSGINFNYAVDGCYYRAHAMRRIIQQYGYDCNKLFVYGNLGARSLTGCCASWVYHVAPFIRYRNSSGQVISVVIDPSLFVSVVSANQWINACKNSSCKSGANYSNYQVTDGAVYYASPSGNYLYDPFYTNTDCVWQAYSGMYGCTATPPSTAHCGY